jgi:hypothetical protein
MTAAEIRSALACDRSGCGCRRGRATHCPSHDDRLPSFYIDERGDHVLFICRAGCRQTDVLEALRTRGLWRAHQHAAPGRSLQESPLVAARRQVLADARAQRWADEGIRLLYEISDWIRSSRRHIDTLRDTVAPLGSRAEHIEAAQTILAAAASLETFTNAVESELDDILADGRYR